MTFLLRLDGTFDQANVRSERQARRNGLSRCNIQFTIPRVEREKNLISSARRKRWRLFVHSAQADFIINYNALWNSHGTFAQA
jgi:hypothetical protein